MNINALTKEIYSGNNQARLDGAKASEGWTSNKWITFLQARKMHVKIKKGAKATMILIPAGVEKATTPEGEEQEKEGKQRFKKCYLFNMEQTEKTNGEKRAEAQAKAQPELPNTQTEPAEEQKEETKAETKTEAKAETKTEIKEEKATPEKQQDAEAGDLIQMLKNRFKTAGV